METNKKLSHPTSKTFRPFPETLEKGGFSKDGRVAWAWSAAAESISLFHSSPPTQEVDVKRFGKIPTGGRQLETFGRLTFDGIEFLLLIFAEQAGSLLLVVSLKSGQLVRAVQLPIHVSMVTGVGRIILPGLFARSPLASFSGTVACGCGHSGHVLLMDLVLDRTHSWPRPHLDYPRQAKIVPFASEGMAHSDFINEKTHLALNLNGRYSSRNDKIYQYCDPSNHLIGSFEGVTVTAIHHVPLVCGLLVAYNFSGFQLFSLLDSSILYSLPIIPRRLEPPIVSFAVQEPENDPRHFLYVWVARNGPKPQAMFGSSPSITLYQMAFKKKIENHNSSFYQDVEGCNRRFDYMLWPWFNTSAMMMSACTLERVLSPAKGSLIHAHSSATPPVDSTLVVFMCRGIEEESSRAVMSVFDLNGWYNCQMPLHPSWTPANRSGRQVCPFLSVYELSCDEGCVLEGVVCSLSNFSSPSPFVESHNSVGSLSFTVNLLTTDTVVAFRLDGAQSQVINELLTQGANVMGNPAHFVASCQSVDLYPVVAPEGVALSIGGTVQEMHSFLLSVFLHYKLEAILLGVAKASLISGFHITSAGVITWIKKSLNDLITEKTSIIDRLLVQSEKELDPLTINRSFQICQQLSLLCRVISELYSSSSTTIDGSAQEEELSALYHTINIHHEIIETAHWCMEHGLLPHLSDVDSPMFGEDVFVFPTEFLERHYYELTEKREGDIGLIVDHLINYLPELEGVVFNYPPTDISCLLKLRAYPNTLAQQLLVLYILLDIATPRGDPSLANSYAVRFQLKESLLLAQFLWNIDHGDDPILITDSKLVHFPPILKCAVERLLEEDKCSEAIQFLAQFRGKEPCLHIRALVYAGHMTRAFNVLEEYEGSEHYPMLLERFVDFCLESSHCQQMVKLQLKSEQLDDVCEALGNMGSSRAVHVSLCLLLHHRRHFEAVALAKEKRETCPLASVLSDSSSLPPSQQKMCSSELLKKIQETHGAAQVNVTTEPFSSVMAKSKHRSFASQADLLLAVTEKVAEIKVKYSEPPPTPFKHTPRKDYLSSVPFISTPYRSSRLSQHNKLTTPSATPSRKKPVQSTDMGQFMEHMEGFKARMAVLSALSEKKDSLLIRTPLPYQLITTPAYPASILKTTSTKSITDSPAVFNSPANRRIRFALEDSLEKPTSAVSVAMATPLPPSDDDSDSFYSLEGSSTELESKIEMGVVQMNAPEYTSEVTVGSSGGQNMESSFIAEADDDPVSSHTAGDVNKISSQSVVREESSVVSSLRLKSVLQSSKGKEPTLSTGNVASSLSTPSKGKAGLSLSTPVCGSPKVAIKRMSTSKSNAAKRKTNPVHSGVMVTALHPPEASAPPSTSLGSSENDPYVFSPPLIRSIKESKEKESSQTEFVFSPPLLRSASKERKEKELNQFGPGIIVDKPRRSQATPTLQTQEKPLRSVKTGQRRRK